MTVPREEQHKAIVGTEYAEPVREASQCCARGIVVEQRLAHGLEPKLGKELQRAPCILHRVPERLPGAVAIDSDHGDAAAAVDRIACGLVIL